MSSESLHFFTKKRELATVIMDSNSDMSSQQKKDHHLFHGCIKTSINTSQTPSTVQPISSICIVQCFPSPYHPNFCCCFSMIEFILCATYIVQYLSVMLFGQLSMGIRKTHHQTTNRKRNISYHGGDCWTKRKQLCNFTYSTCCMWQTLDRSDSRSLDIIVSSVAYLHSIPVSQLTVRK